MSRNRERQRVVLDLDPDTELIAGSLRSAGGATSEFAGYLALIQAIEAIRSGEDGGSGGAVGNQPELPSKEAT